MIKNSYRFLIIQLFLFLAVFNQNAISKTLPPGSGAGDVKANILILLDTSLSMSNKPFGGAAIYYPGDLILLDDGDVIVGQTSSAALVKFTYSDEKFDSSFVDPDGDGVGKRMFMGDKSDGTCSLETGNHDSRIRTVGSMDVSKDVNGTTANSEIIYSVAIEQQKVVAIDAEGNCIEVIDSTELGKTSNGKWDKIKPLALDIRTIGSSDYLIITGLDSTCTKTRRVGRRKKRREVCVSYLSEPFWYARNLSTGATSRCIVNSKDDSLDGILNNSTSISMDDGNYVYFVNGTRISKYSMSLDGAGVYCPTTSQEPTHFSSGSDTFNYPSQIAIDPQDDSIMYATSSVQHTVQKLAVSSSAITTTTTVGTQNKDATPNTATADATKTNLYLPSALFVSNDRAWIGGGKISIQEFNISSGDNITWVDELGTTRVSRAIGAKNAISAVVNDSSLTSGAYFGYGFWNGGTEYAKRGKAKFKWCKNCEYTCHRECPMTNKKKSYWNCNNHCNYYRGWVGGTHPTGQSKQCDQSSCLAVGVGPNTTNAILEELKYMKLRFATDANAFSQMAEEYYNDPKVNLVDDAIPCQLNYVILIGDGKWTHHSQALTRIKSLRDNKKVKTIVFAYGGGISGDADENFKEMAKAGSCDDANFGTDAETDPECRQRIIAESPADLVQKLRSEVERIIASRLSFSAPSITATIQEGGDLYQAQFEYTKHGEWTGHLLRKKIKPDGSVVHDLDEEGNWNAGDKVRAQAQNDTRKIWTALKGADYKTDYNNFVVKNATLINKLFQINGNSVADYHNLSSACKAQTAEGVANGNSDDIDGLIKFVRGYDYFGYKGCANMGEIRDSVLGDIYHSQIVEVARPSANTLYTGMNQEAYFRSKNGYAQWAAAKANRERTLYVGANDGMLHAFDAANGDERWAFVPPFIAGRLPEIINTGLDGVDGGSKGGTNSIFAVDGSPVVHDMYITGILPDGTWETEGTKSWHTILFIPYGRGGRGYSVLDVTDPLRPHHIFSVYNDWTRKRVMIAKQDGTIINDADKKIDALTYTGGSLSVDQSLESERAIFNQTVAYDADIALDATGDTFTNRDDVATCSTSSTFYIDGSAACYHGSTYTFNYIVPDDVLDSPSTLEVYERIDGVTTKIEVSNIVQDGSLAKITLASSKYYNVATGDEVDEEHTTQNFDIVVPNAGTEDARYDYSSLGETWSTPRIFRLPVDRDLGIDNDQYVAVLPGGFGKAGTLGSSVFIIDLENMAQQSGDNYPGALVAGGDGLIKIADLDNAIEIDGSIFSDVGNNITGDPVVITPDTFRGAKWRGAMVYVNDFEGKITKINLTSDKKSGDGTEVNLFDYTTLFSLNANQENARYSYFGMDAAFGTDSRSLYLFGSTGDFGDIGSKTKGMDNILYGIRDKDFPNFRLVNVGTVGSYLEAQSASKVDENYIVSSNCVNTAEDVGDCPAREKDAWIFKLDQPYNKQFDISPATKDADGNSISAGNRYRKASASPTVYKGTVYYPVYEPPPGSAACSVGNAFICSADDECGTNTSKNIEYAQKKVGSGSKFDDDSGCYYLQPGVLSKLVVFSDKLFANITTSSEDQKDTLISLLSTQGYISSLKGGWRHNF